MDENPYKSPAFAEPAAHDPWLAQAIGTAFLILLLPLLALLPCILAVWIATTLLQAVVS